MDRTGGLPLTMDILARWWTVVGGCLFLSFVGGQVRAQTTVYTWTDEKGVIHYSDSMVPAQHIERATTLVVPSHVTSVPSISEESGRIPLVIRNNDPSQKFVRVTLSGEQATREVLMLVDTGAQITLIDEALAEDLLLEHVQDAWLTGVTGTARGWIGRLPLLRLGTEEVRDLPIMVGPLPGRLLLGMDVLERLDLSVGSRTLQRTRE